MLEMFKIWFEKLMIYMTDKHDLFPKETADGHVFNTNLRLGNPNICVYLLLINQMNTLL